MMFPLIGSFSKSVRLAKNYRLCTSLCSESKVTNKPGYGICFDIDGVIIRGANVIPAATEAVKKLIDSHGKFKVPVCFVTNGLWRDKELAQKLTKRLQVQVSEKQIITSGTPLRLYKALHHKRCLFLGQGALKTVANEFGFSNPCIVDDIAETNKLLDVVSHDKRKKIPGDYQPETLTNFEQVEAIISLTEPDEWDKTLQIAIDLLMTSGDPRKNYMFTQDRPDIQMIGSNFDLIFMHQAHIPRFGHGSFLLCLQEIYKKLTGKVLPYSAALGKPSEITFRYAEHRLHQIAETLGYNQPIKTMYMIGDNPQSDICGANLYQKFIQGLSSDLPFSRQFPSEALNNLTNQTVENCHGLLVCTGVYKPPEDPTIAMRELSSSEVTLSHSNKEFQISGDLLLPKQMVQDVNKAVDYIVQNES